MLLLLLGSCAPVRRQDFETTPRPKLGQSEVVLDVGRRYGVVASGIGLTVRAAPDPSASQLGRLKFAEVVATTGEASGADGKVWRRLETGGWASREALLVFPSLREAVNLMVELRVFSSPELRRAGPPAAPRPLVPTVGSSPTAAGSSTPGPTRTPTLTPTVTRTATSSPTPSPRPRTSTTPQPAVGVPAYGVVVRPELRAFSRPGTQPSDRAPLEAGTAVALIGEGVGPDGQRYVRTEDDLWLAADGVRIHATLPEATEVAYRTTMEGLAPGVPIDPAVAPALWLLRREPDFRYLAESIAELRVPIQVGSLGDPSLIGSYSFADRTITISDRYVDGDIRVLAVGLAHEATHTWERGQGLRLNAPSDCFEAELRAFRNQALLWEKFNGPMGKEKPASAAETEQNEVLRLVKQDPEALKARLVARYAGQCGYHGPVPEGGQPAASGTPPAGAPGKLGTTPAPAPAASPSAGATPPAKPAAPTTPAKPAPTPQPKVATP